MTARTGRADALKQALLRGESLTSVRAGLEFSYWRLSGLIHRLRRRGWPIATERRHPNGLDAPAAGWVDRLEVRAGAIWGHVKEWTARARQQLAEKAYRFISPVFQFEKTSGRIVALTSAALTNAPNLALTALNSRATGVGDGGIALTEEERQIARQMGVEEADLLRTKRADAESARNAARLDSALSAEERRVCECMGVDPGDYLARRSA